MSDGLGTAVIALTVVLVLIGCGLVWWVVRPQPMHREVDEPRVLPLFGVDQLAERGSATDDDDVDGEEREPTVQRPLRAAPRAAAPPPAPHRTAPAPDNEQLLGDRRFAPRPEPTPFVPPPAATVASANGASQRQAAADLHHPAAHPNGNGSGNGNGRAAENGQSRRFSVAAEGTLQFLPGRLEVVAGHDLGREIRFVRTSGPDGADVTFGRSEGPLYRHVQLHDQTVSRSHARMRMIDGRWHLANLSSTNPVSLNGRALGTEDEPLNDGDQIEMGEVVFRFRSR